MARLSSDDVQARIAALEGWELFGDEIRKDYEFADFTEAIAFVNQVAAHADRADHHPDILIRYNRVRLTLSTHDSGGLTERDFRLAARIDAD